MESLHFADEGPQQGAFLPLYRFLLSKFLLPFGVLAQVQKDELYRSSCSIHPCAKNVALEEMEVCKSEIQCKYLSRCCTVVKIMDKLYAYALSPI